MNNSRQQIARDNIRESWSDILNKCLETAIEESQAKCSAKKVISDIISNYSPDKLIKIDECESDYLARCGGITDDLWDILKSILCNAFEVKCASLYPGNPYFRGAYLRNIINGEIQVKKDDIKRSIENIFISKDTDIICSPQIVKNWFVHEFKNYCFDECSATFDDDKNIKLHLKILTALTSSVSNRIDRRTILSNIIDDKTSSFPFVVKYIDYDKNLVQPNIPKSINLYTNWFNDDLMKICPQSQYLINSLERPRPLYRNSNK